MVSKRVTTARALKLFSSFIYLRDLTAQLAEYNDRAEDLSTNIEELLYRFVRDMYDDAKKYDGDLPGADVVRAYLGELFENQGPKNPTPPVNP